MRRERLDRNWFGQLTLKNIDDFRKAFAMRLDGKVFAVVTAIQYYSSEYKDWGEPRLGVHTGCVLKNGKVSKVDHEPLDDGKPYGRFSFDYTGSQGGWTMALSTTLEELPPKLSDLRRYDDVYIVFEGPHIEIRQYSGSGNLLLWHLTIQEDPRVEE